MMLYAMMRADTVCSVRDFECGLGGFACLTKLSFAT